jgi:two-component system, NtrC family, nitrogen regulation sensor histidine kinase GlnL
MTSGAPRQNPGGPAVNHTAAPSDLSSNLRRLDRLASLGLVSASVAHEIKNGLVPIGTYVEMLSENSEDKELTEVVRRELARINQLVNQMLRFAAPKAGAFTKVHAHELLDHSLRLLEHQMNGRLITLHREYRAASDTIQGNESQLQQAFMNLIFNALEAVGNNGEVHVSTAADDASVKISVRDTGPGIPSDNLPRLFEPFFTTKKNGTGLGLAICQRIVEEHHGRIEVHSECGKGSVFTVCLPRG